MWVEFSADIANHRTAYGGTREVPCYQLTKTECLYIATKFNDEASHGARHAVTWVKVNGRNFALVEYKDAKGELRPITRCQARCDAKNDHKNRPRDFYTLELPT